MDDIVEELRKLRPEALDLPKAQNAGNPISAPEVNPVVTSPAAKTPDVVDELRALRLQPNAPQPVAPNEPAPASPQVSPGDVGETALDRVRAALESQAAPVAAEQSAPEEQDSALPIDGGIAPETPPSEFNLGAAFTGGVGRGVAQVAAAPFDLAGIASEFAGDEAAAQSNYNRARAIEAYAGPSNYTWGDVNDFVSFSNWLAEKAGEQAPVWATMFTGAGAAGLTAQLAGKALLKQGLSKFAVRSSQFAGGATAGAGLETAGTGSELRQATGSYQPETAVAAGVAKGIMEFYGPAKLISGLTNPASTVVGELVKGAFREGLTEGAQELVDATARAYEDENYEFWSRDTWVRTRESLATGFFVGGSYAGGGKAISKGLGLEQGQKPGTQQEVDPNQVPPATEEDLAPEPTEADFADQSTWRNPLVWLRGKFGKRSGPTNDAGLENTDPPINDYAGVGSLLSGVNQSWKLTGITAEQIDYIKDFEDAVKPRFFIEGPDGKVIGRALTDTEAELELSLMPAEYKPRIWQADITQMNAGSLTADVFDLPTDANSNRIFFAPHVTKEQQAALREQYNTISGEFALAASLRLDSASDAAAARQVLDEKYSPLVAAGLRVIPSRGAGFIYRGAVEGTPVEDVQSTGRGRLVFALPSGLKWSQKILKGATMERAALFPTDLMGDQLVAIDFNKVKFSTGFASLSEARTSDDFDLQIGKTGWLFREGLSEDEKTTLAIEVSEYMNTERSYPPKVAQAFWERGVAMDPTVYELTQYHVMEDVERSALTPAPRNPDTRTGASMEGRVNAGKTVSQKVVISPAVRTIVKDSAAYLSQDAKDMIAAVKQIAPQVFKLGNELGLYDFNIVIDWSTQGTAHWHPGKREIRIGVASMLASMEMAGTKDVFGATWSTMLHELGHGVTMEMYAKTSADVKRTLRVAYDRARLYERLTGDDTRAGSRYPGSGEQISPVSYYLTYVEWLAEQFTRWSYSQVIPLSNTEVFYQEMANKFKQIGDEFVKIVGPEKAQNLMTPSWQFATVMEYLRHANRGLVMASIGRVDVVEGVSNLPAYAATVKAVEEFRKLLPANTNVEINAGDNVNQAEYWNDGKIIRLWAGALANNGTDPRRAVVHEALHASRSLFTQGEWARLVTAAKQARSLPTNTVRQYQEFYAKQGATPAEIQDLVDEERVAWFMDSRIRGKSYGPVIDQLVDAFWAFVGRIREVLSGFGIQNVADLERLFFNGEIAARFQGKPGKAFVRPPAGTATPANDNRLSPEEVKKLDFNRMMMPGTKGRNNQVVFEDVYGQRVELIEEMTEVGGKYRISIKNAETGEYLVKGRPMDGQFSGPHSDIIRKYAEKTAYEKVKGKPLKMARLATDRRELLITPQVIKEVEPGMWMAAEVNHNKETGEPSFATVKYYQAPTEPIDGLPLNEQLMRLGDEIGYLDATFRSEALGWEIDMVQVNDRFRAKQTGMQPGMESYGSKVYKYTEKEFGRPFKPSGTLTPDGIARRRRLDPLSVQWYVHDDVSDLWFSPNQVANKVAELGTQHRRIKRLGNSGGFTPQDEVATRGVLNKWKRLEAKIDPKAWDDPTLSASFNISPDAWARVAAMEAQLGLQQKESELDENAYANAITGEQAPQTSAFDQIDASIKEREVKQNARILKLDDMSLASERQPETEVLHAIRARGVEDPTIAPILSGIVHTADRVSKFSKLIMGIQQIAWRNPHIGALQKFVALINNMQAQRMKWVERANETARAWDDSSLSQRDRDGLADLMFWATEMEYLSPAERAANVVRKPTPTEVAQYLTQHRLSGSLAQLYDRVQGDFDAFLTDVERVSAKNLSRTITDPAALQAALAELKADMANMRAKPYFPMVRFGEWTITIRDPASNDDVVFFAAYATERERDSALRQLAGNNRQNRIQIGRVTEDLQEFMGLPAPLLRQIKNMPGLSQSQLQWIEQFEHQVSSERSFRKRWLARKGTPGYSRDGIRAYSHYFLSGSNYLSRLDYKNELQDEVQDVRASFKGLADSKKRSLIAEAMQTALKYIMEPGRDWAKFKAFVSLWQLGFSPAAAAMNLLQTPTVTVPYFSGVYGGSGIQGLMLSINNSIRRNASTYRPAQPNPQYEAARLLLKQMGKIDVGQAPELGAYAEGYNLLQRTSGSRAQRSWRKLSHMGMWMFGKAEQINREIAFGLSWEHTSKQPNHQHLVDLDLTHFTEINQLAGQVVEVDGQQITISRDTAVAIVAAREAIDRTQFVYAPWARPGFLRGPLMSSFLIFFQYTQSMIYAMGNNPGNVKMILVYALLFGALGLPGADDLDEVLNALAKRIFGKEFSLEAEARQFVRELSRGTIFEEVGPDLLVHGLSKFSFGPGLLQEGYGIPQFDASANGSLGQVIPGLAQAANAIGNRKDWKDVTAEVARDTAGAGFGQMFALLQFLQSGMLTGDMKKWEAVMPRAARAMSKASRYYLEEKERTKQGGTFVDFDVTDPDDLATIAAQAFGFTPTKINTKWNEVGRVNDIAAFYQGRKTSLMEQYNEALIWKDREAAGTVRGRILEFNRELRERAPELVSLSITSDGLKASMQNRARTRAMQDLGLPAQKNQIGIQQYLERTEFPQVPMKVK